MAIEKWLMAPDLKNQEPPSQPEGDRSPSVEIPSVFINQSTNDCEPRSLMASRFRNKDVDDEIDISASDVGGWSCLTETPLDFGNQNQKTDMSTLEEGYSSTSTTSISDNNLADAALPDESLMTLEELEKILEL